MSHPRNTTGRHRTAPATSRITNLSLATLAAGAVSLTLVSPATAATVATGTPFVTAPAGSDPQNFDDYEHGCTIAATGTDQDSRMLALTAGHCTEVVGDQVYISTTDGYTKIGTTEYSTGAPWANPEDTDSVAVDWNGDDFAVIALDDTDGNGEPNQLSAGAYTTSMLSWVLDTPNIQGGTVTAPGDVPVQDTPVRLVYKDGASTGHVPGLLIDKDAPLISGILADQGDDPSVNTDGTPTATDNDRYFQALAPTVPGDSGGAVYDMFTGEMLGINSQDRIIGDSPEGRNLASPRAVMHTAADATTRYTEDTGNQFNYTEDVVPVDQQENIRHPQGVQWDEAIDELGGLIDDAIQESFAGVSDKTV